MPEFDLDLFEAIDELEVYNMSFEDILKFRNGGTIDLANSLQLQQLSELLCRKFRKSPKVWPYQLQLMINAYLTESKVLDALNSDKTLIDEINNKLPEDNKKLDIKGSYYFKGGEKDHTYLVAAGEHDVNDYDIECASEGYINTIEIKTTKNKMPLNTNFHDAEIVLYYTISNSSLGLLVKVDKDKDKYRDLGRLQYPFKVDCVSVVPAGIGITDWTDQQDQHLKVITKANSTDVIA